MMKHKLILSVVCIVLVISLCSCGLFGRQRYVCDIEQVTSIQIIQLDKYVEGEYRYEYTVLAEISDCATFVNRLNSVKHSVNWGEPSVMYVQYIVIRVEYKNGDFDELHADAQWFNRSGVNHAGYFFFDDDEFNMLINDYLTQ